VSRRKTKIAPGQGMVAWGWYAILFVPAATAPGGSVAGTVLRAAPSRAFWCAWWTEDPHRNPEAEPDDFGFVEGGKPVDAAIGAAYDSLRRGRGRAIFDVCVGEALAAKAYRAGAPVRRSVALDVDALAAEGLRALGLRADATVAEVKAAFRREAKRVHPDQGGDAAAFRDLQRAYDAVLAVARRREEQGVLADVAAGKAPPQKRRRSRKAVAGEQESL
jgi:hypothetical protein